MNNNVRNLIFLAVGVVLALLFLIFATNIYEAVKYFDGGYSNELYNHGMYSTFATIIVVVTWLMAVIYYYIINSVRFDRWPHWLIMFMVSVIGAPAICLIYNEYLFNEYGLVYLAESLQMVLCHVLFTVIMFVVATFSIRWWSSNCRHSPF